MRITIYEQYATVREDTATTFTSKLNEEIYRLRHHNPTVVISESDPLCAYVKYTISESVPETVSEASDIEGVRFTCAQCPYFKAPLKEDGTIDKRCKHGDCPYTELGRTLKTTPACDKLFDLIVQGNVHIVINEED